MLTAVFYSGNTCVQWQSRQEARFTTTVYSVQDSALLAFQRGQDAFVKGLSHSVRASAELVV